MFPRLPLLPHVKGEGKEKSPQKRTWLPCDAPMEGGKRWGRRPGALSQRRKNEEEKKRRTMKKEKGKDRVQW